MGDCTVTLSAIVACLTMRPRNSPLRTTGPAAGREEKPCSGAGAEVLERNIVVHVVELARGFLRGLLLARGDGLSCLAAARFSRALPASEHLHAIGDDFGGGALLAFLVLPL